MIDNPFRPAPGSAPPALVGRDPELSIAHYAIGLTAQGGAAVPTIFIGRRGMGKTALLRRCVTEARDMGGVVLYAEASKSTPLPTLMRRSLEANKKHFASPSDRIKGIFDTALRAMPEASFELPDHLGEITLSAKKALATQHEAFRDSLDDLNLAVRKKGRFLVIAIDEIQDTQPESMRTIIELTHSSAGTDAPILLLGAGLTNSEGHLKKIKTYAERWRYASIDLLTRAETIAAIQDPAKALGVTFEKPALDLLIQETDGYPFFVQEYASASWIEHTGKRVTLANVEAVAPGVRRALELSYYDSRMRSLTPRELRYVLALASLGPGPHGAGEAATALGLKSPSASSIRNRLVDKEVLFVPWAGSVEFRMPLTERYLERHREEFERRIKRSAPALER